MGFRESKFELDNQHLKTPPPLRYESDGVFAVIPAAAVLRLPSERLVAHAAHAAPAVHQGHVGVEEVEVEVVGRVGGVHPVLVCGGGL